MPTLKRNVKGAPEQTGFESYDGPEPPLSNRMYRGRIEVARVREASTGTLGYNLLVKLEAEKDAPEAKYDGYPAWVDLWLGDKEPNQAREAAFYRALGVSKEKLDSGDVPVKHKELDDGGEIQAVAGKKPVGQIVKVDLRVDRYEGVSRLKADSIWPASSDGKASKATESDDEEPPDDETDLMQDDEERRAELEAMKIPAVRAIAREYELKVRGVSQEDLIEAILEAEAEPEEGEAEGEGDAEPDDAEREAELQDMSLPALRKLAKEYEITTRGKSSEKLVEEILEYEAEAEPENGEPEAEDLYATVKALSLPKLRKWALENGEYKASDLKDLEAEDILEMLVDDEVLSEPPF